MAVGDAYVFLGFLTPVLTVLSFESHRIFFSHTLAEARGENTPERKFASTGYKAHNHQVMSSPLGPKSGAHMFREGCLYYTVLEFFLFPKTFSKPIFVKVV